MIREAVADDGNRMAEINVTGWRFAYRNLISDENLFKLAAAITVCLDLSFTSMLLVRLRCLLVWDKIIVMLDKFTYYNPKNHSPQETRTSRCSNFLRYGKP
jgi:hypothetical protein